MDSKQFGDFSTTSEVPSISIALEDPTHLKSNLVKVKKWEPHVKSHGSIVYDGRGHFCAKIECEVNRDPRSPQPVFDAIDRGEY